ncbi:MAG TPA: DUF3592 domain-containing protein [Longimicrobium sp.]|nr:DUF3592 domain-containing protein [Longimicrobium sp.]
MPVGIMIGLGVAFIAFGVLAMGAAAAAVLRARRDAAARIAAWGVVVALRPVAGLRGPIHCPVVRFHARSGEMVTFESTIGGQPPLHAVGQQVTVFYRPDQPREAELEVPPVLWIVPAGIFAVGLVFAALGGVLVLAGVIAAASPPAAGG